MGEEGRCVGFISHTRSMISFLSSTSKTVLSLGGGFYRFDQKNKEQHKIISKRSEIYKEIDTHQNTLVLFNY